MERADGDAVVGERGRGADGADGEADNVDSVGDGVVEGGEHVGVEAGVLQVGVGARDGPADLVDGEPGEGGASGGGAAGESAKGGDPRHSAAGGGRSRVGAVAIVVAGGAEGGAAV